MTDSFATGAKRNFFHRSVENLLFYGLLVRLSALAYAIFHDSYIDHIKYTDIDYHVFTNASKAIAAKQSPYKDPEYRYSPIVALLFLPNVLVNQHVGKLLLIIIDIICGRLIYRLSISQGVNRMTSKVCLAVWLFNPISIAISTRGSFEPIITFLVLSCLYMLSLNHHVLSGLIYGISIHTKLYPIIYGLAFYGYMIQKKPYMITQTKTYYWIKTIRPNFNHFTFFMSTLMSLSASSYLSYLFYEQDYLEQSLLYHLKRKDMQHNFSVYFYLFRLFPNYHNELSITAFTAQLIGVTSLSIIYLSLDSNRRTKLRKLTFSLFSTTFIFVSLNKVCTSQYFMWYLVFLPLVLDNLDIDLRQAFLLLLTWFSAQANWLLYAYLYEYQGLDVIHYVGCASIIFLVSNLYVLRSLCSRFNPVTKQV